MFVLTRDVTAAELAVDSLDDEGYRGSDIIGDTGSRIEVVSSDTDSTRMIEVTGFSRDPFVVGFVHESMIREV
jgi:hypothetical protein